MIQSTYVFKILHFDESHHILKLVFAVYYSLLHELEGLGHQLKLIYYLFKCGFHFWLQFTVCGAIQDLLGGCLASA